MVTHWTQSSLILICRLASEHQISSVSCLHRTRIIDVHHQAWLFTWVLRNQLSSVSKMLTLQAWDYVSPFPCNIFPDSQNVAKSLRRRVTFTKLGQNHKHEGLCRSKRKALRRAPVSAWKPDKKHPRYKEKGCNRTYRDWNLEYVHFKIVI